MIINQQLLQTTELSKQSMKSSNAPDTENEKSLISQMEYMNQLKTIYKEVIYYMDSKKVFLDPHLSLIKFSSIIGTNTTYLSKAINKYFGYNFKTLINNYRIEYSKDLLMDANSTFSIKEIAQKCGFLSISAYYSSFKKITQVSPLQYKIIKLYTHAERELISE